MTPKDGNANCRVNRDTLLSDGLITFADGGPTQLPDQRTPSEEPPGSLRAPVGDAIPALRLGVRVSASGSETVLETEDFEICVDGLPNVAARQIVSRFNGRETAASIAGATAIPLAKVVAVIAELVEYHVVVDLRSSIDTDLSAEEFIALCRGAFPIWKTRLFSHPLWRSLNTGDASRHQFLGWLLETYHFAEGVNLRLPLAIAQCSNPEVRDLLSQHYAEEYNHAGFFLTALNEIGLRSEIVAASRPLPGTHALLNYMRDCARRDSLHYAVCGGFLEATGTDRAVGKSFFTNLSKNYAPDNPRITRPLAEHAGLDEVYGHGGLVDAICRCTPKLSLQRASSALGACELFVETLELWSTDILVTYAQPSFAPHAYPRRYRDPANLIDPRSTGALGNLA